mmetsp:Transcript_47134/g.75713  ORF Transcript_47134/g.75713 Transcript_47134/m.75713 type:complete len:117 (+) Transcript_47134:362-712(+)
MYEDKDDIVQDSHFNMRSIQQQLHFKLMPKVQDNDDKRKGNVSIDGQSCSAKPMQSAAEERKMDRSDEVKEVDAFNFLAMFLSEHSSTAHEETPGVLEVSERSMKIMDDLIGAFGT